MRKIAALIFLFALGAHGQPAPLRVLSTNGIKAALEALKGQCEKAAARPLAIQYNSSAGLKRLIEGGEAFDLAILTPEVTDALVKAGKIAPGTAVEVARMGVGFGIRAGAPKLDVSTPEAVKQTLMRAKSVSVVKEGASRPIVDRMFEKLGITAAMTPKTVLESGTEKSGESVAQGRSEIEIIPLSEIPLVAGVQTLAPLPADFQSYLHLQASVSAHAADAAAAKKMIQFLTSQAAAPVYGAKGMETK